jgi:hypothetical protein
MARTVPSSATDPARGTAGARALLCEVENNHAAFGVFVFAPLTRGLMEILRKLYAGSLELMTSTLLLLSSPYLVDDERRKHVPELAFRPPNKGLGVNVATLLAWSSS